MKLVRTVYMPEVTFSEWVIRKGFQLDELARDIDYANLIGGIFTAHTRAAKGRMKDPLSRVSETQRLKSEYDQELATGKMKKIPQSVLLDWNRESDRAYVRMKIKRAKTTDEEVAWRRFYDSQFCNSI